MKVIVEKNEIDTLARELYNYSEEFGDEIKKIRNIAGNIGTVWSGNDASKYIEVLQEKYILGLEDLKQIIEEYAIYLNNIPEAYELLDNIYADKNIEV